MIQTILFDFDGTLFDTGEGILRSVQYALDRRGGSRRSRAPASTRRTRRACASLSVRRCLTRFRSCMP